MTFFDRVRATMKCADTEGNFELYVTRTPGYLWALFFRRLHVHPIAVTLLSIVIGIAAGPCLYSKTCSIALFGCFLLVWANWYDCADGQLARMTGQRTLIGRILDGFAGDIWFFSIYVSLAYRLTNEVIPFTTHEWGILCWLLLTWVGICCHGRQCAVSDYYRNVHMWMVLGRAYCELDSSADVCRSFSTISWSERRRWFEKVYLYFYSHYCKGQEDQTPSFQRFRAAVEGRWGSDAIPQRLREDFRQNSLPLMPTTNLLTFDFRVSILFLSVLSGYLIIYPLVEATLMEYWRYRMRKKHERFCLELMSRLSEYE